MFEYRHLFVRWIGAGGLIGFLVFARLPRLKTKSSLNKSTIFKSDSTRGCMDFAKSRHIDFWGKASQAGEMVPLAGEAS